MLQKDASRCQLPGRVVRIFARLTAPQTFVRMCLHVYKLTDSYPFVIRGNISGDALHAGVAGHGRYWALVVLDTSALVWCI